MKQCWCTELKPGSENQTAVTSFSVGEPRPSPASMRMDRIHKNQSRSLHLFSLRSAVTDSLTHTLLWQFSSEDSCVWVKLKNVCFSPETHYKMLLGKPVSTKMQTKFWLSVWREGRNHHVYEIRLYVVEHRPTVLSGASSVLEIESKSRRRQKASFLEFIWTKRSENLSWLICWTKMKSPASWSFSNSTNCKIEMKIQI